MNLISRAIEPIKTRIMMAIARGVIESINDSGGIQTAKASFLAGENRDNIERFQNFGFTGVPPDGSECVTVFPGGNREHGLMIAVDHRDSRLTGLEKGECAIYTDDGTKIHLKKGGLVDVIAATKVTITCPEVEMSGNLKVMGDLTVIGTSLLTGAVSMLDTLTVALTATINGILSALGFSGIGGAAVSSTVNIETSANVKGGGTDLADIKSTFNSHTHPETGITTNAPNQTL